MTSSNALDNKRDLSTLSTTDYDVLVIGGGISGAWLTLHCAQQGYKTALIEKHDYASQTSSSSSKLLHGGVRYLPHFQFKKVRESAMERAEYLYAAPHLSTAVPFIMPTYKSFQKSKFFLGCGMLAYQTLCVGENNVIASKEQQLPTVKLLSHSALNELCDLSNENHTGGVMFYERHMLDSERMVLAIIQSAKAAGADVFNYVSAQSFIGASDTISGVNAKDEFNGNTFDIKAKLTVNSSGPWIDELNSTLKNSHKAPSINGFAVGSHIVTRKLYDHAIAITTKHKSNAKIDRGGRHMFIIPWRGFSLIGTSYDEIDSPNSNISLQASHVDELLEAINDGIPSAELTRDDLISGFSGLYPLHTDNIQSTVYQGSGEYQIIDHTQANGVGGLITALGAKFTTGRKLSELTMRVINEKFNHNNNVRRSKLIGSDYESLNAFTNAKVEQYAGDFSAQTIRHLIMHYGSRLDEFVLRIKADDSLKNTICNHQDDIFGQVVWAIDEEQCWSLNDVLFNRTSLGLLGIQESELTAVARVMAEKLHWSDDELRQQIDSVTARLNHIQSALQNTQSLNTHD